MQVESTPRYLRVKAVAKRFDVSPSTIYRAIEAGGLASIKIGGSLRVPESALLAFEAAVLAAGQAGKVA